MSCNEMILSAYFWSNFLYIAKHRLSLVLPLHDTLDYAYPEDIIIMWRNDIVNVRYFELTTNGCVLVGSVRYLICFNSSNFHTAITRLCRHISCFPFTKLHHAPRYLTCSCPRRPIPRSNAHVCIILWHLRRSMVIGHLWSACDCKLWWNLRNILVPGCIVIVARTITFMTSCDLWPKNCGTFP